MAKDTDGAYLAHVSDTLEEHGKQLSAIQTVLGMMLDTLQAQTEMLTEVLAAARDEPGDSPVAQALTNLTAAVGENTQAVNTMAESMNDMASLLVASGHEASDTPAP
ncbi:hypothetical protein Gbth_027_010 [Gluconobacter thailandicus F149-1 = NBRC 100600]|mgnify:FL=1|jgi:phytoene/squalene synthetase|uniref:Uncharacterized protein n=7 Tax=Acetobacteraceae TaxID=433 RepID=A0A2S3VYH9_9PROT|nr:MULTISPECIES: hypothetical protein [Acetobacteraceae]GBO79766.1 hypothetical protein AA0242T_0468 [Acetobacter aceti NRIC 0242]KXV19350.1 hypothetical protein AD933_01940 [Acetobacter malorum]KXV29460.1 hypothetical protein AD937_00665 [Gluconobacter japonicus]KXV54308.1 hypothetical protein AD946_03565 [Gluconobacter thailandicus]KXV60999.1 hypothetical protein AD947_01335 [Acetobacter tropicalis]